MGRRSSIAGYLDQTLHGAVFMIFRQIALQSMFSLVYATNNISLVFFCISDSTVLLREIAKPLRGLEIKIARIVQ